MTYTALIFAITIMILTTTTTMMITMISMITIFYNGLNSSVFIRVSILTRDIDIANMSVCLSVRNVPVSDENGLTYRHSFFTIRSPIILVLPASNTFTKF